MKVTAPSHHRVSRQIGRKVSVLKVGEAEEQELLDTAGGPVTKWRKLPGLSHLPSHIHTYPVGIASPFPGTNRNGFTREPHDVDENSRGSVVCDSHKMRTSQVPSSRLQREVMLCLTTEMTAPAQAKVKLSLMDETAPQSCGGTSVGPSRDKSSHTFSK